LLATNADDCSFDDGIARVICSKESYTQLREQLVAARRHLLEDELIYIPITSIDVDTSTRTKLPILLQLLEDEDDIDAIWHNAILFE
jgi:transcriptional/translational regulatory protein YebC/TACO1